MASLHFLLVLHAAFLCLLCDAQSTGPGPSDNEDVGGGAPSEGNDSGGAQEDGAGASGYTSIFPGEEESEVQEDAGAGSDALVDGDGSNSFAGLGPCVVGFGGNALQFGTYQVLVTSGRCRSSFRATSAEDNGFADALAAAYTPAGGAGAVCRTVFTMASGPEYLEGATAVAATSPDGKAYAGKVVQGKCHFGVAPDGAGVAGSGVGQEVFTRDFDLLSPDGFAECDVAWTEAQRANSAHLVWWPEETSSATPEFADQYVICMVEHEGMTHAGYARGGQLTSACDTWCATRTPYPECEGAVCRACAPCGGGAGGTPGRSTSDAPASYGGMASAVSLAATVAVVMACI